MYHATPRHKALLGLLAVGIPLFTGCTLPDFKGLLANPATTAKTTPAVTASPTATAAPVQPTPLPQAFANMPAELNAGLNTSDALNAMIPQLNNSSDTSTDGSTVNGVLSALSVASQPSKLFKAAGNDAANANPSGATLESTDSVSVALAGLPVPPDDNSTFATNLLASANFSTQAIPSSGQTIPLGSADAPLTLDSNSASFLTAGTSLKVYGSVKALTSNIFLTVLNVKAGSKVSNLLSGTTTLASDALLGHDTLTVSKSKGMSSYGLFIDPFTQGGVMMVQRTITSTATGATMKFVLDFRDFSNYKVDANGNFSTPGFGSSDSRCQAFRYLVKNYSHAVVTVTYVKSDATSGTVAVACSDVRNFSGQTVLSTYSFPTKTLTGVNNNALLSYSVLN